MITYINKNIFDVEAEALVNTVNLEGVMGKGIALQFKQRFPGNFTKYKAACKDHSISIGKSLVVKEVWKNNPIWIINFPTKTTWRKNSEYEYIDKGLDDLIEIISNYGIRSIAIPPLGAGNGKLDWKVVKGMIENKLSNLDCNILIIEPGIVAEEVKKNVNLTPARAMLTYMLHKFQENGYDATVFNAVKAIYFLQKFGAKDIFKLRFEPHIYGPYCDTIRHIIHNIDGAYIRGFSDMTKKPFEPFDINHQRISEVKQFIESDIFIHDIVMQTCEFMEGYWDEYNLELLSSVDYLITEHPTHKSNQIHDLLCQWSARKRKLFEDKMIFEKAYSHIKATSTKQTFAN